MCDAYGISEDHFKIVAMHAISIDSRQITNHLVRSFICSTVLFYVNFRTGWEERYSGKPAAKPAAKAVAEAAAKPAAECLSSFYISHLATDILSQPGLTHALLLFPGCKILDSIPKLCIV